MSSLEDVDRLSMLPEEILSHILSLMPTKFAVRTSILSERWRYTWTFVTNLHFDDSYPCKPSFPEFVDRVLELCKSPQVNLFRLHLCYDTAAQTSSVLNWIDKAVALNVRELDIHSFAMAYEMPCSFFTCNTLTKLRISFNGYGAWECPVNLPSLKILDFVIHSPSFPHAIVFNLINGCPMLESLSLQVLSGIYHKDFIFNIPTLKRLQLRMLVHRLPNIKVVLNVPNLEYLILGGGVLLSFVMEDVSSLVEASISRYARASNSVWDEFLKGVSGAKSPLGNEVGSGLLNPKSVPICLLTNLTTIKFSNCKGLKSIMKFLEYILENAKILKTVTITWDKLRRIKEERLRARFLNLTRASTCCEIQFY